MKKSILVASTLIMSFIGGFFDVYCLIYRGGKFCFLQTGNLLNLAVDIINNDLIKIYLGLIIFSAFLIGLVLAYLINYLLERKNKKQYTHLLLLVIINLLVIPTYFFEATSLLDSSIFAIICLGLIGGILLESFRNYIISFTATMMTNNCKLLVDSLVGGILNKNKKEMKKSFLYLMIILSFMLGVFLVVIINSYTKLIRFSPLIPQILLLVLVFFEILKIRGEKNNEK